MNKRENAQISLEEICENARVCPMKVSPNKKHDVRGDDGL